MLTIPVNEVAEALVVFVNSKITGQKLKCVCQIEKDEPSLAHSVYCPFGIAALLEQGLKKQIKALDGENNG